MRAVQIELTGEQIPLAVEHGRSYDRVTKVTEAQEGLLGHIEKIKSSLSYPKLPINERPLLEQEFP